MYKRIKENQEKINIIEIVGQEFNDRVLESKIPVLVEFKADWCGPCHIIAPHLNSLSAEFENKISFFIVDNDRERTLAKEYGVHLLPTILFFDQGKLVNSLIGAQSKDAIREKIEKILN